MRSQLPQAHDIAQRRGAKEAAILATELRRALVPDLKCRRRRIEALREHQPSRLVQTQPFLILQWAHGRQSTEMIVERRFAHIDLRCEVIDTKRPG
jgi:hypothetical protein